MGQGLPRQSHQQRVRMVGLQSECFRGSWIRQPITVSLQLQQGFSIGIAAVSHVMLAYSCSRDSP